MICGTGVECRAGLSHQSFGISANVSPAFLALNDLELPSQTVTDFVKLRNSVKQMAAGDDWFPYAPVAPLTAFF